MSELFPQNLNSNQFDPKVKCYKYNLVTILETGANFGDIALQNSVQKIIRRLSFWNTIEINI